MTLDFSFLKSKSQVAWVFGGIAIGAALSYSMLDNYISILSKETRTQRENISSYKKDIVFIKNELSDYKNEIFALKAGENVLEEQIRKLKAPYKILPTPRYAAISANAHGPWCPWSVRGPCFKLVNFYGSGNDFTYTFVDTISQEKIVLSARYPSVPFFFGANEYMMKMKTINYNNYIVRLEITH